MTILPGQPRTTGEQQPPPRRPRRIVRPDRRGVVATSVAAVVLLAGGGTWYALHSAGSSKAASPVTPTRSVHHVGVAPSRLSAPVTRTDAMRAATKIFAVLPATLPGWSVSGTTKFDTASGSDPLSRSIDRCFGSANNTGISVDSPSVSHTTAEPTNLSVDAALTFVRSSRRASADLAALRRPAALSCMRAHVVGRKLAIGRGATLQFDSMRQLHLTRDVVGVQFDGQVNSDVIGSQAIRVVMLATVDRATEILVTSAGLGASLPLTSDVRILQAVRSQTREIIG
jgi:hypothetical protein